MKTFTFKVSKYSPGKIKLGEILQNVTKLDFAELADAATKGAVWHQKNSRGKILRIRSLHIALDPQDTVTFYYDNRILSLPELTDAECVAENANYGVWLKVAGVMPQGTQTGDHTSLLRLIEKKRKKEVFLVHRLDRETEGLMVIAYNSQAAGMLSELFLKNKITKTYQAVVKGELAKGSKQTINYSLDGKEAITHYEVLDAAAGKSLLKLRIDTGRLHQIRRHLEFIGHPVMGDPKYGKGNKNRDGLKLLAKSLSFIDPWTKKTMDYELGQNLSIV
jgi:tRNA pseudouridine32 synthase / 23S rRNA pseudouridine746 synthase